MPFLLRVELPDVPGSLGRVASAIGEAGGDIEAIEIVEKRHDGQTAVDDVLLEIAPGRDAGLDRVGLQRARRRPGRLDQPVRRRRQPVPRPRGGRGADRRPGQARWTGWSTCCRSRSAPTGRPACCAASGVVHATEAARRDLAFAAIGRAARAGHRRRQRALRRPARRRRDRDDRPPRRPRVPRLRAGPPGPPGRPRGLHRPPLSATGSTRRTCRLRLDVVGAERERSASGRRQASSRKTGISRSVFSWYSPYVGQVATACAHHSARSSPSAIRAM